MLQTGLAAGAYMSMPPMPPWAWPCPPASFFFGASATLASVVIIRPAIEAASCSAVRTK